MGYDMRFVTAPDGEAERVSAVRRVFHAACDLRGAIPRTEAGAYTREEIDAGKLDQAPANASPRYKAAQAAIHNLYELLHLEEASYFRLNIGGMSRYAEAIFRLGMAYDSRNDLNWPDWQPYPDDPAKQDQFEAARGHFEYGEGLPDGIPGDVMAAARQYAEQAKTVRWHHPEGGTTIPLHKFGTNDGWIVTPEEIMKALATYDAHPSPADVLAATVGGPDRQDYWDRWIAYLRAAVHYGGFEVH